MGICTLRGAAAPRLDQTPPPRWSKSMTGPTQVTSRGMLSPLTTVVKR